MTITSLAGNYDKPTEGGVCRLIKEDTLSTDFIDKSNFSNLQYATDVQNAWDCGYAKGIKDAVEIVKTAKAENETHQRQMFSNPYYYDKVNNTLDEIIELLKGKNNDR